MCGLSLKEIFEIFRSLHLLSCVGDVRHFADFVSRVSESLIIVAGGVCQDLFISKYLPLVSIGLVPLTTSSVKKYCGVHRRHYHKYTFISC